MQTETLDGRSPTNEDPVIDPDPDPDLLETACPLSTMDLHLKLMKDDGWTMLAASSDFADIDSIVTCIWRREPVDAPDLQPDARGGIWRRILGGYWEGFWKPRPPQERH